MPLKARRPSDAMLKRPSTRPRMAVRRVDLHERLRHAAEGELEEARPGRAARARAGYDARQRERRRATPPTAMREQQRPCASRCGSQPPRVSSRTPAEQRARGVGAEQQRCRRRRDRRGRDPARSRASAPGSCCRRRTTRAGEQRSSHRAPACRARREWSATMSARPRTARFGGRGVARGSGGRRARAPARAISGR